MKVDNILDAIGTINDKAVQDARLYKRPGTSRHLNGGLWQLVLG